MGLLGKLRSKLEIYRLEQKYTRRKNRATFTTGVQYKDGEYVHNSDTSSPVSQSSTGNSRTGVGAGNRTSWMPGSKDR